MLNKNDRDAIQIRLNALTAATPQEVEMKEYVASLLTHTQAADEEIARLAAALDHEKVLRERAEKGLDYFTSGDWVI